jgi:hypothetical protein
MNRGRPQYSYRQSLKSDASDELINTYLIRPVAGILVRLLYQTRVSPNHVTLAAATAGIGAALLYAAGTAASVAWAGTCIVIKDVLDSADGQLARAQQRFSRTGRFFDSISDIVVNFLVFGAIGFSLLDSTESISTLFLSLSGFAGITLRVSYHVFYQTAFLHLGGQYTSNRLSEELTEDDRKTDRLAVALQRVYQAVYGWQDRLMMRIDSWCRTGVGGERKRAWYSDVTSLRLSALLGMGTELGLLSLFSLGNRLQEYLWFNLVVMNGLWLVCIAYRRVLLAGRLR